MPKHFEDATGTLGAIVQWLVFDTSPAASTAELLHGFAQRLCEAGFDLIRLNLQVRPLSPQAAAVLFVWRPIQRNMELPPHMAANVVGEEQHVFDGGRVQITALAHGVFQAVAFRASPIFPITLGDDAEVRRRITPGQTEFEFPILKDLETQGATDYIAFPLQFYGGAP